MVQWLSRPPNFDKGVATSGSMDLIRFRLLSGSNFLSSSLSSGWTCAQKTLDLTCKDEFEFDHWVTGLKAIFYQMQAEPGGGFHHTIEPSLNITDRRVPCPFVWGGGGVEKLFPRLEPKLPA